MRELNVIPAVLKYGRRRQENHSWSDRHNVRRTLLGIAGFEDRRRGRKPKHSNLETEKG